MEKASDEGTDEPSLIGLFESKLHNLLTEHSNKPSLLNEFEKAALRASGAH